MTIDEYQAWTGSRSTYPGQGTGHPVAMLYAVLGAGDESGEIMGKTKKAIRGDFDLDGDPLRDPTTLFLDRLTKIRGSDMVKAEVGDALFYLCRIAKENGWSMSEVMDYNHAKIEKRFVEGKIKGSGDNR